MLLELLAILFGSFFFFTQVAFGVSLKNNHVIPPNEPAMKDSFNFGGRNDYALQVVRTLQPSNHITADEGALNQETVGLNGGKVQDSAVLKETEAALN